MIRIHKEGRTFLFLLFFLLTSLNVTLFLAYPLSKLYVFSSLISLLFYSFFLQFFRNPIINKTTGDDIVVSPANGKVVYVGEVFEPEYFQDKRLQISIFMSPFDVHINRNPVSGIIKYYKYHKGKYLVAWHPKSSTKNERTTTVIENKKVTVLIRQIAGFVARRVVNYSKVGSSVKQSDQLGFIKFGSRADLFLPLDFKPSISINQKTIAGETVIGKLG